MKATTLTTARKTTRKPSANGKVTMSQWPNRLGWNVTDTKAGVSGEIQCQHTHWAVRMDKNGRAWKYQRVLKSSVASHESAWELTLLLLGNEFQYDANGNMLSDKDGYAVVG